MTKINLASDNYSGIHPQIVEAIIDANQGPAQAYGHDQYTQKSIDLFHDHFGANCEIFFVLNGTGANVTALSALIKSYQAIICTDIAHIQVDEGGAPEKFSNSKLLTVPHQQGKLTVDLIKEYIERVGDQHHVQPKVISITQSTEYGTVYELDEIKIISEFAHQHDLFLHMDGARISNAAVSLNLSLKAISKEVGVDVLTVGGTKNGMMFGEAVVFFNPQLAKDFIYIRKQSMQLLSKMRFISAQFEIFLSTDLWRVNAQHANKMAAYLEKKLSVFPEILITQKVNANAVFAIIPKDIATKLQEKFYFYFWDELISEVRLMTSFDTTQSEIDEFINTLSLLLRRK